MNLDNIVNKISSNYINMPELNTFVKKHTSNDIVMSDELDNVKPLESE